MDSNVARATAVTVLTAGLGVGALAVVHNSQSLDRQGKIVIAAGNSQYYDLAKQYQESLRKYGVEMDVRRTTRVKDKEGKSTLRPLEGRLTLRALMDDESGITAAFVKGNLVGSLQGRLASEKQKGRHAEYSKLRSVGRLFYAAIGRACAEAEQQLGSRGRLLLRASGTEPVLRVMVEGEDEAEVAAIAAELAARVERAAT